MEPRTRSDGAATPAALPWLRRIALALLVGCAAMASLAAPPADGHWATAWSASPDFEGPPLKDKTLRQVLRPAIGGASLRVRLSNLFGAGPVTIGPVHVALQQDGAAIQPGTDHALSFNGSASVTIPKGGSVLSDALAMNVKALKPLSISLYLPTDTGPSTVHATAMQTVFISPGNATAAARMPDGEKDDSRYFLTDVEVAAAADAPLLVVFGDSIVDGVGSTVDGDKRWPDQLAARLQADPAHASVSVANAGIAGNRLLDDGGDNFVGPSGVSRFERDVLTKAGVRWVLISEGVNDIAAASTAPHDPQALAGKIIDAMKSLADRAHAKGVKVIGGTLLPHEGAKGLHTATPAAKASRAAVDDWMRTAGAFDAVVDFDKVVRDPSQAERLLPAFDSGDHLHPNNAGYAAMAAAIDLRLFDSKSTHDRFVDDFLAAWWALYPTAALNTGLFTHADELPPEDAARRARKQAFVDEWLRRVDAIAPDTRNAHQRADLELIRGRLNSARWYLTRFKDWQWDPSGYNVAEPFEIIMNTDYAPLDTRLRTVSTRLAQVPAFYAAARANIERPTLEHTDLAILQNKGGLATFDDRLLQKAQASSLTVDEKKLFADRLLAARSAVQGYIGFLDGLRPRLAAGDARPYPIGRALYEEKFRIDNNTGFEADELYGLALKEKARLHDQMAALSTTLWPRYFGNEPRPEDRLVMIRRLLDKLSLDHVKREDLVDAVRRQIPQLEAFVREHDLVDQDPAKPLKVRETPAYQRGGAGASVDAAGPYNPGGDTFYNVTPLDEESPEDAESTLREYNRWMLQILNIHEAIPGHYTQLVHANRSPSIVKSVFGDGATIEGWAVYGERMMLTAGYGDNAPEMWLFWMKWNLRTVCNTILDHQVHTAGMTREQMMDLVVREAFQEKSEAREKWRRATLTSVQLTSYFAGYTAIWRLREEEEKRLGKAFDLKAFHNQFLSYGSAPVPVIQALMREDVRSSTRGTAASGR